MDSSHRRRGLWTALLGVAGASVAVILYRYVLRRDTLEAEKDTAATATAKGEKEAAEDAHSKAEREAAQAAAVQAAAEAAAAVEAAAKAQKEAAEKAQKAAAEAKVKAEKEAAQAVAKKEAAPAATTTTEKESAAQGEEEDEEEEEELSEDEEEENDEDAEAREEEDVQVEQEEKEENVQDHSDRPPASKRPRWRRELLGISEMRQRSKTWQEAEARWKEWLKGGLTSNTAGQKAGSKDMLPAISHDTPIKFSHANPKKPGSKSAKRYERYRAAQSFQEALKLGASRTDLSHDVKHGYVNLDRVRMMSS
eukprot:gnl/TRDRNA2_/TRDRNA2_162958_c0_seq6.p1 gnl/TRDRNA2_/TRDRNA2_162958_c0~~gnl/TRDRNA2_/TRDRNA2_162958_c0_seq6.p1  ORF type:complete len:309 (+),score=96.32 gnl/TRDRNA2_/TRDRNA2_162958_c0_seq6:119-1045(+)